MSLRLLTLLAVCLSPCLGHAGEVRLTAPDGQFSISGDLLDHTGEFFRIRTEAGDLTLDGGTLRCSGEGCPDPADLVARARIGGTEALIHRLMPALLEVFADQKGLDYVRKFTSDNSVSWELTEPATNRLVSVFQGDVISGQEAGQRLASRRIDIALSEKEARGPVRQDVIALDALVPIVAPQNPRAMVTFAQLAGLMSGRIASWERLGGSDLPVSLHLPEGWQSETDRIYSGRRIIDAARYTDMDALADAVAVDGGALGLVPYSAMGNAVPLVVTGTCGLATPATRESIRAEDYPITRPLFLQRIGARQPKLVRDFIAFSRSAEAQPVVRAAGFVDQAIGRISFERQGDRIANAVLAAGDDPAANMAVREMIGTLLHGARLTLTFRFRDGSSDLDPQSASNVQRLADAIAAGRFQNETLLFAGFSDGLGAADANLRLSSRRARAVQRAISARLPDSVADLRVAGFGEVMPMACDDSALGRQVNRRVEVWVIPSE